MILDLPHSAEKLQRVLSADTRCLYRTEKLERGSRDATPGRGGLRGAGIRRAQGHDAHA